MRRAMRLYTLTLCLILANGAAYAAEEQERLSEFVRQQVTTPATNVEVRVKGRVPSCSAPHFVLPARKKSGGHLSVRMMCGKDRYFIPVEIRITGRYIAAARAIQAGHQIGPSDIAWRDGRIDTLMATPLFDAERIIGAVSQRPIGSGQAIGERMLRRPWAVTSGQLVEVAVGGDGFRVTSQGKVMNNAAVGDKVRVRMDSGLLVEGNVIAEGKVEIVQ